MYGPLATSSRLLASSSGLAAGDGHASAEDQGEGRAGGCAEDVEGEARSESPGSDRAFVDSPKLALQAHEITLELGGEVHACTLPRESCWWFIEGEDG